MTKDLDDEKNKLNNADTHINRGFELMLRPHKRKEKESPKTFQLEFGKMISFLKTEIHFYFNFQLDIKRKRNSKGERQC